MFALITRTHEINEQRSNELLKRQALQKEVSEWNRKVNELTALLERSVDNPPTSFDRDKLDHVMHYFKP